MKEDAISQLETHLRNISILAHLMQGQENESPLYLFHGCARIIIKETTAALEQIDETMSAGKD